MRWKDNENEMIVSQDGEEVDADGDEVHMANLCVMLHYV
jgi:hypothetical protein